MFFAFWNLRTNLSFRQFQVRVIFFLRDDEKIFLLLCEIMISQACKLWAIHEGPFNIVLTKKCLFIDFKRHRKFTWSSSQPLSGICWANDLNRSSRSHFPDICPEKKKTFHLLPLVVRILRTRLIDLFLEQDHILDFSEIAGITSVLRWLDDTCFVYYQQWCLGYCYKYRVNKQRCLNGHILKFYHG